ncbi:MAG: opioid growth factor receptor-related protein [Acidobacteriota bacterium]
MPPSEDLALLAFYRGDAPDWNGRRLDEIWSWPDERLEAVHDYIQWMFPLSVPSGANPGAPVLGPITREAFATTEALRERLDRSLRVMLRFYGLELMRTEGALQIARTAHFTGRARVWLSPGNHNHLRLTRIITSLGEAGLAVQAHALWDCLSQIAAEFPDRVTPTTLKYWRSADAGVDHGNG